MFRFKTIQKFKNILKTNTCSLVNIFNFFKKRNKIKRKEFKNYKNEFEKNLIKVKVISFFFKKKNNSSFYKYNLWQSIKRQICK